MLCILLVITTHKGCITYQTHFTARLVHDTVDCSASINWKHLELCTISENANKYIFCQKSLLLSDALFSKHEIALIHTRKYRAPHTIWSLHTKIRLYITSLDYVALFPKH